MAEPLRSYLLVQAKYDRQVRGILQRTATDLARRIRLLDTTDGVGAQVRAAQLRLTLQQVNEALSVSLRGQLGSVVADGAQEAAEAALRAAQTLDGVLVRAVGRNAARLLSRSLEATAQRGLATDMARQRRELSPRVYSNYRDVADAIESTIRTGLISGNSPRELARTVYQFVSPTTPGGASYNSMRLARTEINNAFHNQQVQGGQKPWVEWSIWNLSGSHRQPDQCNVYASQRRFKPADVPGKPHPQCLCYITYDTDSPDEFVNRFLKGDYDEYLDEKIGATSTASIHGMSSPTRKKAR